MNKLEINKLPKCKYYLLYFKYSYLNKLVPKPSLFELSLNNIWVLVTRPKTAHNLESKSNDPLRPGVDFINLFAPYTEQVHALRQLLRTFLLGCVYFIVFTTCPKSEKNCPNVGKSKNNIFHFLDFLTEGYLDVVFFWTL